MTYTSSNYYILLISDSKERAFSVVTGRWRTIGRDSEEGRKGVLHIKNKKETKGRGNFTSSQLSLLKIQAREFLKTYNEIYRVITELNVLVLYLTEKKRD